MGSESSDGFGSNKRTTTLVESDSGGLGLKLQRTESFLYKTMLNQNRQFETSSGICGPSFDIYDGVGVGVGVGVGGGVVSRTMQPFKGGMAAATLRFPFTSAQWMELERQALIFKHMMASVPIPPDLLLPIRRSISDTVSPALGRGTCFNLRFSNNTDPEPGRCRRTDGKKWRCSRDVAPDQKYCERHMNRGRPRSRKHVEVQAEINKKNSNITRPVPSTTLAANTSNTSPHHAGLSRPCNHPYGLSSKPDFKVPTFEAVPSSTPYKESRCSEWMTKGSNVTMAASNQDLQQFMQRKANSGTNSPVFSQQYQESLNLNSFTAFGEAQQQPSDQCYLFLNSELAPLDDSLSSHRQTPRRFIDAWSNIRNNHSTPNDGNKTSVSGNGKLSPSTLSLSMSGDNGGGEEDVDQIRMGLNVEESERENAGGISVKSPPLSWMAPVSWVTSAPGGPLGEVLQSSAKGTNSNNFHCTSRSSSSGGGGLNLLTDGWAGSNETSPRATIISSPSGVLQKTLASLSDSSGCSSPTFGAATKSEIALPWMIQSKLPST